MPVTYPILVDAPGPADAGVWLGNRKGVLPYSVLVGADGKIAEAEGRPFAAGEIDDWSSRSGPRPEPGPFKHSRLGADQHRKAKASGT